MKSFNSKHGAQKHNLANDSAFKLVHERLYNALNLGFRSDGCKGTKWECVDIGTQRYVAGSISTFLDYITTEMWSHLILRDSVADIVQGLVGILKDKNETVLPLAASVLLKLIRLLPSSMLQYHANALVHPCSSLLHSHHSEVAISCAAALNLIVSNLGMMKKEEVWDTLKQTAAVTHIVCNILRFHCGSMPTEYFRIMASLLSTILCRWHPSRYSVWNNSKLMIALEDIQVKHDLAEKVEVLKLYAAIALCASGAKKIHDDYESVSKLMLHCMGNCHPLPIRMEAFRLAQCLLMSEQKCLKLISFDGEAVVKSIVDGLKGRSSSARTAHLQLQLLVEACRLALITRWSGKHHLLFWKFGVDKVLCDLLVGSCDRLQKSYVSLPLDEQISVAREYLNHNVYPVLRPYIWEILGYLAAHCNKECTLTSDGNESITMLITCVCLVFVDSARKHLQIHQTDIVCATDSESVSWAVMMLIYSPSKSISSKTKLILSYMLKPFGTEDLTSVLTKLNLVSPEKFGKLDAVQLSTNLILLACFLIFSPYQDSVIRIGMVKALVLFVRWCTGTRPHFSPRLSIMAAEKTCCSAPDHWEGRDFLLLLCLWVLDVLVSHCELMNNMQNLFSHLNGCGEAQFMNELEEICSGSFSPGAKYLAAHVLSFFGVYGFPCKFGDRIGKTFYNDKEYADLELIFASGQCLSVHGIVLMVRCPALLPPNKSSHLEGTGHNDSSQEANQKKVVRLSPHVDYQAFVKLLRFMYMGQLQAEVEIVNKLKIITKRCHLQELYGLLSRKGPKWGVSTPLLDFRRALDPAGKQFSDMILEAEATKETYWTCDFCSLSVPHMHVHRVVLWANCEYLQALFRSGMADSRSQTMKVPVSYEALVKLVHWLYSDRELPEPPTGCIWDNMNAGDKLDELQPYLELSRLAEFWMLNDLEEECFRLIVSHLDSARELSVKMIQSAANLSMWRVAEVAANVIAPLYSQLHNSGELEVLDEKLVEMIRAASVRLSQETSR